MRDDDNGPLSHLHADARLHDERQLAFQLALADRLRPLSSHDEVAATASEMLGQHLQVSRVVYAEIDDQQGSFSVRHEWCAPGAASMSGVVRRLEDFGPEAVAVVRAGETMVVHDVAADPRTARFADSYAGIGVRSNLAVPLVKAGQLVVVLSLHAAQPRLWSEQEIRLVKEVAERTWLAVQAARAEAALRETQTWMTAMFDSLPVGVGVFDTTGTAKLTNQAMRRYLPGGLLPSRDAARLSRWLTLAPDGSAIGPEGFPGKRASRGERVVPGMEMRYTADDGQQVWTQVAAVPIRDAQGQVTGQVSVVHDIDAVKRAEAALRQSEARYRALFTKMDAGFCIVQVLFDGQDQPADVRYVETNPMFHQQTGMGDVIGRGLRELVPGIEQFWIDGYAQVARSGEPARFENYSAALGRWFDVNAFPLGDPADQVAVLFSDVTERRKFDEELRRLAADLAESNRRQSEFLAVLAHELRNPLAPILTGLELMRLRPDNVDTAARVREIVERQTRQMVHLIDDLLDIARVTSGKIDIRRQPVDLHDAVATAVETSLPVIEAAGHALSVQLHEGALPLSADPTRLAQIVSNLLTNAAKYTPRGGKIRLAVEKDGDEAIVSVTDNGLGIPAESLASIFEMFSQVERDADTARSGLGIGLALVRQLVSLHGGTVHATSDGPGHGSTFIVRLPLAPQALLAPPAPAVAKTPERARMRRILVADDNVDAAESLAALLALQGHETLVAHDGPQALQVAAEHVPEVVFLDIGMPGMTGYEVARQMRTMAPLRAATLVAVTGWGTDDDRARAKEAGFDGHLTKPVAPEALEKWLVGQGG